MIDRRALLQGFCGLAAVPAIAAAAVDGVAVLPPPALPGTPPTPAPPAVQYTIVGWDEDGAVESALPGVQVVALHLPASWRASWF